MSVQYFKSLLFKFTQIQQEIKKEQNRRLPDWMRLLKLKKLRLVIKDKLQNIAREGIQYRETGCMQPVMVRSNNPRASLPWEGR